MAVRSPRELRGRILTVLYNTFQRDPMVMMTPSDIADAGNLKMDELAANCHYLHDRSFIELMMGYNPGFFAAARIAPEGIDLFEDRKRFVSLFGGSGDAPDPTSEIIPLVLALAREAEVVPTNGLKREWLLADISRLRDLLRRPHESWDEAQIANALQWLAGQTGPETQLPSLAALEQALARRIK
jgi:hypothetical protein